MLNVRTLRFNLIPGQEIPFQAGEFLYVSAVNGSAELRGSGSNSIPSGIPLTSGMRFAGPTVAGVVERIGVVYLINTAATGETAVEVMTSNGEIDKDPVTLGSTIAQANDVYSYGMPYETNQGGASAQLLYLHNDNAPTKRIALRRMQIINPGYRAAGGGTYLLRLYRGDSGAGGSIVAPIKHNPAGANPGAVLRAAPALSGFNAGEMVWEWKFTIGTAWADFVPRDIDFTDRGTRAPIYATAGANQGFGFTVNSPDGWAGLRFWLQWTEA